jgi:hypothetical protein
MAKHINLLVSSENLSALGPGHVGFLIEQATDGPLARRFTTAARISDLIGTFHETKATAAALARKLLTNEPAIEGIRHLTVFEELVIRQLQLICHAWNLLQYLKTNHFTSCRFFGASELCGLLQQRSLQDAAGYSLSVDTSERVGGKLRNQLHRVMRRLTASPLSLSGICHEVEHVLNRLDPFRRRKIRSLGTGSKGKTWFYSTAATFTQIGTEFERYCDDSWSYLIENTETGGVPLTRRGRRFDILYSYGTATMIPRQQELCNVSELVGSHLLELQSLNSVEECFRDLLMDSEFWHTFVRRLLPLGIYHSRVFGRFFELREPRAFVVGNPVFEAYGLVESQKRGVPTVLLQHGVLGDFCQFVDPPVDNYIVLGEFWKEFLSPAARAKSQVINGRGLQLGLNDISRDQRDSIVFVTAPYSMAAFWDASELVQIIDCLVAASQKLECRLVIRVHPLEKVDTYRRLIEQVDGTNVEFSQHGDSSACLRRAAVAVLFSSTMFLDCLKQEIPVISFGWHDFSWKSQIASKGVFYFCKSFSDLTNLLTLAIQESLPPYKTGTAEFLEQHDEAFLKQAIQAVTCP